MNRKYVRREIVKQSDFIVRKVFLCENINVIISYNYWVGYLGL